MSNASILANNRRIVTRFYEEYWCRGNPDIVDELCADNFAINCPIYGRFEGREAAKGLVAEYQRSFPTLTMGLLGPTPIIVENDYVILRWFARGGHIVLPSINPEAVEDIDQPGETNEMRLVGTSVYTIVDGKITEEISETSSLRALQRLSQNEN
ncbi:hypothetical protein F5884DRAFT_832381 [Xylogone sp. PMI_703]|nr:hypothetical protein F5884DRAFT_832381 [Xylogone sp. PMI_703]